jgi:hypothetical protein
MGGNIETSLVQFSPCKKGNNILTRMEIERRFQISEKFYNDIHLCNASTNRMCFTNVFPLLSTSFREYGDHVSVTFITLHSVFKLSFFNIGRAVAQAVSRRIPTAAARIRAHVKSCGFCGGQSGTGAGFLRVLQFLLPILIPSTAPHSSSIIRSWYDRPVTGRSSKWTQSHHTPRNELTK